MYLYELPTTGTISFADFCVDQSIKKRYTNQIPEATQARANLKGLLKESKRADHGEKDFLALIKVLDEYLPHLRGIMACIAHDEIGLKAEPTFSWRTTLSANFLHNSPRLSLPSLHADYAFTLLTRAFATANLARVTVLSLGSYEFDRAISDAERKRKDESLNVAVDWLRTAGGIFSFVADTLLPEWETNRGGGTLGLSKPPELSREVNSALAKMSLAEAQTLAIRKLLSKAAYDSNVTPGPPLPKSHPSPALIAKLHLECASLYSSARSLVKSITTGKSTLPSKNNGEVSADLRGYLADQAALHAALAHKWLGVDAGENGGTNQGGEAVAFLAWAKKGLEELRDSGKGIGLSKEDKEKRGLRKEKIAEQLDSVNVFYKHYRKVNDTLHYQPVPPQSDLQARIPAGVLAIQAKPFTSALPLFGPGSLAYLRMQEEDPSEQNENVSRPQTDNASTPETPRNYAGAGAYF
ncbi:hypothetical protein BDN72DRAFT_529482 [Pluteus cervinus]|uniref:Uncharacterized protein n=1 Tax=Pluteus cervinus TaxID=181527 RepID=A0ACD3B072_9AGAR|nr:hypothetical protein BDN72DRAFT_529482 [Pluteus cervinus]